MNFKLLFTQNAREELKDMMAPHLQKQYKAVVKTLGLLETNLRHPSLRTHKFRGAKGLKDSEVFEAYAENNTYKAYRVFWQYGLPGQSLTILNILPHP